MSVGSQRELVLNKVNLPASIITSNVSYNQPDTVAAIIQPRLQEKVQIQQPVMPLVTRNNNNRKREKIPIKWDEDEFADLLG